MWKRGRLTVGLDRYVPRRIRLNRCAVGPTSGCEARNTASGTTSSGDLTPSDGFAEATAWDQLLGVVALCVHGGSPAQVHEDRTIRVRRPADRRTRPYLEERPAMRVGKSDAFEREYTQKFRLLAAEHGEFVHYERDRAARDIGLHLTRKDTFWRRNTLNRALLVPTQGAHRLLLYAQCFRERARSPNSFGSPSLAVLVPTAHANVSRRLRGISR